MVLEAQYSYAPRNLIITYIIAIFTTISCGIIAARSYISNGIAWSSSFSSIIAITRNHDLDVLMRGWSLGAKPMDESLAKTRLRFGVLERVEGNESERQEMHDHCAIGFEGSVRKLRKGDRVV